MLDIVSPRLSLAPGCYKIWHDIKQVVKYVLWFDRLKESTTECIENHKKLEPSRAHTLHTLQPL